MKFYRLGASAALWIATSSAGLRACSAAPDDPVIGHGTAAGRLSAVSDNPPSALRLDATSACFDAAVAAGRTAGAFSGMAGEVILDGHAVYRRGVGTVGPGATLPVQPSTRFRIGSVTKVLTATALLSLIDERRLELDTPVSDIVAGFSLPGEPGWSPRLTAHLLLSHQGAIEDGFSADGPRDDGALTQQFFDPQFTATLPLWVSPGTFWNYSNPNFAVAGLLAELAGGQFYRDLMRRRVFEPLRMTRAAFRPDEVTADSDYAFGVSGESVFAPDDYDNAVLRPAGWAWASADDLANFVRFLLNGNRHVLSARSWHAMQTRQVNTFNALDLEGYGYGLFIDDFVLLDGPTEAPLFFPGIKMVSHGGNVPGYSTLVGTLPGYRLGFVVVANGDGIDLTPCVRVAIAETVGSRLPPPSPLPDLDIRRDRFGEYVGSYTDRVGVTGPAAVTLTETGDLTIRFPLLDEFQIPYDPLLRPTSRDNFIFIVEGFPLEFTGFREGKVTIMHLRSRLVVLTRSTEAAPPVSLAAARTMDRVHIEDAIRQSVNDRPAQSTGFLRR